MRRYLSINAVFIVRPPGLILGVSCGSGDKEYHPLDIRHINSNIIVYYSQFTEFFILGLAFTRGFSVATGAKTAKEVQMFVSEETIFHKIHKHYTV